MPSPAHGKVGQDRQHFRARPGMAGQCRAGPVRTGQGNEGSVSAVQVWARSTPFSDQLWTICDSAWNSVKVQLISTNRTPNHARTAAAMPSRRNCLHSTLFPNYMHCRLNWPEKGVVTGPSMVSRTGQGRKGSGR